MPLPLIVPLLPPLMYLMLRSQQKLRDDLESLSLVVFASSRSVVFLTAVIAIPSCHVSARVLSSPVLQPVLSRPVPQMPLSSLP